MPSSGHNVCSKTMLSTITIQGLTTAAITVAKKCNLCIELCHGHKEPERGMISRSKAEKHYNVNC